MKKKHSVIVELETQKEEREFTNWALNSEKEKSEGILRARDLINKEKNSRENPRKIKASGKAFNLNKGMGRRRVRRAAIAQIKDAHRKDKEGHWEDALGVHSKNK